MKQAAFRQNLNVLTVIWRVHTIAICNKVNQALLKKHHINCGGANLRLRRTGNCCRASAIRAEIISVSNNAGVSAAATTVTPADRQPCSAQYFVTTFTRGYHVTGGIQRACCQQRRPVMLLKRSFDPRGGQNQHLRPCNAGFSASSGKRIS